MSVLCRRASPRSVVVEGQALVAVGPRRIVRTVAHKPRCAIQRCALHALRRVAIAFAPAQEEMRSKGTSDGREYGHSTAGTRDTAGREYGHSTAGTRDTAGREYGHSTAGTRLAGNPMTLGTQTCEKF